MPMLKLCSAGECCARRKDMTVRLATPILVTHRLNLLPENRLARLILFISAITECDFLENCVADEKCRTFADGKYKGGYRGEDLEVVKGHRW
jgi:hypothetical protein